MLHNNPFDLIKRLNKNQSCLAYIPTFLTMIADSVGNNDKQNKADLVECISAFAELIAPSLEKGENDLYDLEVILKTLQEAENE